MVLGMKTGWHKKASNGNIVSASTASPCDIATLMTLSDETQPLDDIHTAIDETQTVGDKFDIGKDFHTDKQTQKIVHRKAYLLYKDWRYNLKQEFLELQEEELMTPTIICLQE
ncbi:hypothetical protein ACSBR2_004455 [Camellia fascicularis]